MKNRSLYQYSRIKVSIWLVLITILLRIQDRLKIEEYPRISLMDFLFIINKDSAKEDKMIGTQRILFFWKEKIKIGINFCQVNSMKI